MWGKEAQKTDIFMLKAVFVSTCFATTTKFASFRTVVIK